jgi:hypothetical protein
MILKIYKFMKTIRLIIIILKINHKRTEIEKQGETAASAITMWYNLTYLWVKETNHLTALNGGVSVVMAAISNTYNHLAHNVLTW